MSRRVLLPSLVVAALACTRADPSLTSDCAQRAPGVVTPGTGQDAFAPADQTGVALNYGPQGGEHIWLGLRCENLGPDVVAHYGVRDLDLARDLTEPGLAEALTLSYDGAAGADEAAGIYGYLQSVYLHDTTIRGHRAVIWADVTDSCNKAPVHGEAATFIQ